MPQDAKSNPSNGLVERVARIVDPEAWERAAIIARHRPELLKALGVQTAKSLSKAREIHALYQQEGVLSSQWGDACAELLGVLMVTRRLVSEAAMSGFVDEAAVTALYVNNGTISDALAMASFPPIAPASQRGENRSANASPRPGLLGPDTEAAGTGACTMGTGCDEAGVCFAAENGEPERCPR